MWDKLPNGAIDRMIRKYLKGEGFPISRCAVSQIELVAVERPGWKQIFRFQLETRQPDGAAVQQIGIVYDDHRSHSRIELCETEEEFAALLQEWGDGMIHRRISRHEFHPVPALIGLAAVVSVIATAIIAINS